MGFMGRSDSENMSKYYLKCMVNELLVAEKMTRVEAVEDLIRFLKGSVACGIVTVENLENFAQILHDSFLTNLLQDIIKEQLDSATISDRKEQLDSATILERFLDERYKFIVNLDNGELPAAAKALFSIEYMEGPSRKTTLVPYSICAKRSLVVMEYVIVEVMYDVPFKDFAELQLGEKLAKSLQSNLEDECHENKLKHNIFFLYQREGSIILVLGVSLSYYAALQGCIQRNIIKPKYNNTLGMAWLGMVSGGSLMVGIAFLAPLTVPISLAVTAAGIVGGGFVGGFVGEKILT